MLVQLGSPTSFLQNFSWFNVVDIRQNECFSKGPSHMFCKLSEPNRSSCDRTSFECDKPFFTIVSTKNITFSLSSCGMRHGLENLSCLHATLIQFGWKNVSMGEHYCSLTKYSFLNVISFGIWIVSETIHRKVF